MRLSPLSNPHAAACRRGPDWLAYARQRAACNPRQQTQPATINISRCRPVAPMRCSSSCDMEGGSRPKEAGDSPVPRASGQQQAVELISSLLQESLNSQQQTQALVRALLERQDKGREAAAHQPDQLQALIEATLARQHADLMKAISGLAGALQDQQARQEARHQQLLDLLTRLLEQQQGQQQQQLELLKRMLEQQQGQGQQEAASQRQAEQVLRQGQPDAVPHQAAQEAQPPAVAAVAPAASQVVVRPEKEDKQQEWIGLLDYVRVVDDLDMDTDIMPNGTEGLVLGSEVEGKHLKVWSLDDPSRCGWLWDFQLERMQDEGFPKTAIPTKNNRDTCGVPVTRFTAAPGMLVRKGSYIFRSANGIALLTEVGVIQPSYGMGDTCRVMWNSGWEGEYDTGRGDRFKLVHVEVSPTSGAPVVGDWTPYTVIERQLGYRMEAFGRPEHLLGPPWGMGTEGGVAVERGTHWTYGGADPGVGAIRRPYSVQEQRELQEKKEQQEARRDVGLLPVQWPNGQLMHHRASPADGYDLCYSARPGDPVTLFTARRGLKVDMGGGVKGTLHKAMRLHKDGVEWYVVSDDKVAGCRCHTYLVKSHGSERLLADGPGGSPFSGTLEFTELQ